MANISHDDVRQAVRERYGTIAETRSEQASCCGPSTSTHDEKAQVYGYSSAETDAVPQGANLGLGCGNPLAIASLKTGQTVLDLGSGAGFDCFLAARAVGETGYVIGVDMTHEMLRKARQHAIDGGFSNVEFRLGEIECLPVADQSVDVVISNCVITLSPEKHKVYREAFRALRPGGRLAVSDVVATAVIPESIKQDEELGSSCLVSASLIDDIEAMLSEAGFSDIRIEPKDESKTFMREWIPGTDITDYVISASISAVKPAT
ncbi:MAG: arsenite S-adenosylmethyltransferase [Candidatus Entotheonella factor]|uniref:Arsenite methyltransferase n=1 Tax=Entotheonella factor TaxID=1429438 RepID=W4LTX5_ENTF1|nr:arsenite methyltransferase [Candidatus Entotheonella palauensis]ETX01300.1 MAG: arsenite S-adenosylmethyltransferase [Candidatus Entotheonella factor]